MVWSTRQVAELAGTSLRAVRHYHHIGLLAEPQRRSNGYKEYGVGHLVRLVRIKRLTDLGFSLSQIAAMGDDDEHPEPALRALDRELAATVDRLQGVRAELRTILDKAAPIDLPAGLVSPATAARMSSAERSLVVVLTSVLGPAGMRVHSNLLDDSDDVDDSRRQDMAERLVPYIRAIHDAHPGLWDSRTDVITCAMAEVYNEAQLDVLRRAGLNLSSVCAEAG